ncbi:MAG: hypothetical protein F2801_02305 [Actinobacteria bacterium]|nr:hypothetical protein [Actinomycetota bacterium]
MASNFACESVQRSAGTAPKYLYAPAPEGTAEQAGDVSTALNVVIPNAVAGGTPISASFPAGANGIYLVDCVCPLSPQFSISAVGLCFESPANTFFFRGFNQTNVSGVTGNTPVNVVSVTQLSTVITPGQLVLFQNSGGALSYNLAFTKIATAVSG